MRVVGFVESHIFAYFLSYVVISFSEKSTVCHAKTYLQDSCSELKIVWIYRSIIFAFKWFFCHMNVVVRLILCNILVFSTTFSSSVYLKILYLLLNYYFFILLWKIRFFFCRFVSLCPFSWCMFSDLWWFTSNVNKDSLFMGRFFFTVTCCKSTKLQHGSVVSLFDN